MKRSKTPYEYKMCMAKWILIGAFIGSALYALADYIGNLL